MRSHQTCTCLIMSGRLPLLIRRQRGFCSTANYAVTFWELCVCVSWIQTLATAILDTSAEKFTQLLIQNCNILIINIHLHDWALNFESLFYFRSRLIWKKEKKKKPVLSANLLWEERLSNRAAFLTHQSSFSRSPPPPELTGRRKRGCLARAWTRGCVMRVIVSLSFKQWATWNSGLTDIWISSSWIICIFKRGSTSMVRLHGNVSIASLSLSPSLFVLP